MGRGAWSTFLWGESRSVLNRVLFAMVHANDPDPLWLEIRGPQDAPSEPGPLELGWIPEERLLVTREPAEARPQDALGNQALFNVVRSDEPKRVVARLSDFLRLPSIAQEVVGRSGPPHRPRVVGIANTDRVRDDYPKTAEGVRPVIEAFLAGDVLPFMAATSRPSEGRWAFDFVFEVRAKDLAHWQSGWLVPEKAHPQSGFGVGRPLRLEEFPEIARVFSV